MSSISKEISELLNSSGKSASEMTHALKFIGNGSMEAGLSRIGDYFEKEIKSATEKSAIGGVIGGAIGATILIATGVLVKRKIDENKKHKEEGEDILKGLKEGLIDYSEEDNILCNDKASKSEEQQHEGF